MNYSGSTSFEFEIERYKNLVSGEWELPTKDSENNIFLEYHTILLQVEGRSYFQSGKTYGPPEYCYPDEGDTELEVALGPDGKDWSSKLTDSEASSILEMIQESCMNDPYEYDEYDDEEDEDEDEEPDYEDEDELW